MHVIDIDSGTVASVHFDRSVCHIALMTGRFDVNYRTGALDL